MNNNSLSNGERNWRRELTPKTFPTPKEFANKMASICIINNCQRGGCHGNLRAEWLVGAINTPMGPAAHGRHWGIGKPHGYPYSVPYARSDRGLTMCDAATFLQKVPPGGTKLTHQTAHLCVRWVAGSELSRCYRYYNLKQFSLKSTKIQTKSVQNSLYCISFLQNLPIIIYHLYAYRTCSQ